MVQVLSRKQGHLHSFQQYSHNCVVSFGIIWCLLYINAINVKSLPHAKLFFDFFSPCTRKFSCATNTAFIKDIMNASLKASQSCTVLRASCTSQWLCVNPPWMRSQSLRDVTCKLCCVTLPLNDCMDSCR